MKIERVSEHIWSLRAWMIIPIRVWLVVHKYGVTLVDAGIGTMAPGIVRAVNKLEAGPLTNVLLTHGHSDHVGALRRIVQSTATAVGRSLPVFAHPTEIPYMEGDLPYPGRKSAQPTVPIGLVQPLVEAADGRLAKIGALRPYWTPGHSPGHVVYYHEQDRVLLGGDLLMSRRGQPRPPMAMFTGNMAQALGSADIVRHLRPLRLEVAHAGPVFDAASKMGNLRPSVTCTNTEEF